MPTTTVQRELPGASPDQVFALVSDPEHMPRWWPGIERIEGARASGFTQLYRSGRGRGVRMDHTVLERRGPGGGGVGIFRYQQEVAGTSFERVLREAVTELRVEPAAGGGTLVTATLVQKLRGINRFGGFMLRNATRERLAGALEGLASIV